jgi:hypothetical protein
MIQGLNHNRGKRFSLLQDVQTGSGAHPASYGMGNGFLSWGYSSQGMKATTHLKPVPRLKRSTAIPPLLLSCLHGTHRENYVLPFINVNAPSYHFYQTKVITEIISIHRYMHELLIMYKITKEGQNLRVQTGSVGLSDITELHRTIFCWVYDHKQLLTTSFPAVCPHVSEPFPPNSFL